MRYGYTLQLNASSIGLRSGEYGGRKMSKHPRYWHQEQRHSGSHCERTCSLNSIPNNLALVCATVVDDEDTVWTRERIHLRDLLENI